jgi:hypothetical protein
VLVLILVLSTVSVSKSLVLVLVLSLVSLSVSVSSVSVSSRRCSIPLFVSVFWGNGSHFWAESQEESHIDVIGYFTRTNNVVIGDKCRTVMFLVLMTLKNMDKPCFFIRTKFDNNWRDRFSRVFIDNILRSNGKSLQPIKMEENCNKKARQRLSHSFSLLSGSCVGGERMAGGGERNSKGRSAG